MKANPYTIRQDPETEQWQLWRGSEPANVVAADRDWLMHKIRIIRDSHVTLVDHLMEELASTRFRRDALTELLEEDEDTSRA